MTVNNIGANQPVAPTTATPAARPTQPAVVSTPTRGADQLELTGSGAPTAAQKAANGNFRADKVASIKAQLANGTYDADGKLDGAIDKLLNELNK